MKTVIMVRHAEKNENDMTISPELLSEIEKNGILSLNKLLQKNQRIIYHDGSGFDRTYKTIQSLKKYLSQNGFNTDLTLPRDIRFGNDTVRNRMVNNKDLVALKKIKGWYQALLELEPEFLADLLSDLRQAMQDVLSQVAEDSIVIIIGHKPMIELSAVAEDVNFDRSEAVKELEGISFTAYQDKVIFVQRLKQ